MRKTLILLVFSVCFAFLGTSLTQAQTCPTDTVKGKVYYRYAAQKGEGLFRISQNFGVSQEDIIKCNPTLKNEGIKLGQVILIPYVQKIDSSLYIVHEIQPKETLYGLSKRYGVTVSEIADLNPETAKRMAIGSRLLIPRKQMAETTSQQKASKQEIAAQAAREKEDVKVQNPQEETKAIEPKPEKSKRKRQSVGESTEVAATEETAMVNDTVSNRATPTPTPLRIAYLLPLMTDVAPRDPSIDRFLEFYEGALLALNSAKDSGQRFEVYVYDTEKSTSKLSNILAKPEWLNMDVIIGPAYPSQVSVVSQFAYEHQIPVVIPFTYKVPDIERNPYLVQFNPANETENDVLIKYLSEDKKQPNCIFVSFDDATAKIKQLHAQLHKAGLQCTMVESRCVENDSLSNFVQADVNNVLILPSEKYSEVQNLFRYIQPLGDNASVSLLSFYAWNDQPLPLPSFYSTIFHGVKGLSLEKISYSMNFRRYFGNELENETPRYDYLGYDITRYTIQLLQQKQADSRSLPVEELRYRGLQSDIECVRVGEHGGFENHSIQIQTR